MKILFSQILTVAVIKEPGSILDCPGWALAVKISERRRKRKIVAIIYVCVWLAWRKKLTVALFYISVLGDFSLFTFHLTSWLSQLANYSFLSLAIIFVRFGRWLEFSFSWTKRFRGKVTTHRLVSLPGIWNLRAACVLGIKVSPLGLRISQSSWFTLVRVRLTFGLLDFTLVVAEK